MNIRFQTAYPNNSETPSVIDSQDVNLGRSVRTAFYVMLFLVLLSPRYFSVDIGTSVSLANVALLGLSALGVSRLYMRERLGKGWLRILHASPIFVAMVLSYPLWQILSDLFNEQPGITLLYTVQYIVSLMTGFFIATIFLQDERLRRGLIHLLMFWLVIVGMIGIYEMALGVSFVSELGIATLSARADVVSTISQIHTRGLAGRAASIFTHSIVFGQLMAAFIPMSLMLAFRARGGLRIVSVVAIAIIPIAITASNSRSSAIVIVSAFGLFVLIGPRLKRTVLLYRMLAICATASLVAVLLPSMSESAHGRNSGEASSTQARYVMLEKGTNQLRQSPLLGFGGGTSAKIAGIVSIKTTSIDSLYVTAAVDSGYVGLGLMCGLFLSVIVLGLRLAATAQSKLERCIIVGFVCMTAGIAIGQAVLSIGDNLFFVYLAAGYFVVVRARRGVSGVPKSYGIGPMALPDAG